MLCHAFKLVGDAAIAYRNNLNYERNLACRNVKSLVEAKQEIEALIREIDQRNKIQGKNNGKV